VKFNTFRRVQGMLRLCSDRGLDLGPNEVIAKEASRFRHVPQWRHGVDSLRTRAGAATGDRRPT
jgi:hypothetical protein